MNSGVVLPNVAGTVLDNNIFNITKIEDHERTRVPWGDSKFHIS